MFFFFPTMHTEAARVHHRPADTPQPPSHDKIICWVHSIECKAIDRYLICIIHSCDCNFVYTLNIIIIQMNQLRLYYIHTLYYSVTEGEAGLLKWQSFPVQDFLCMQKIKIVPHESPSFLNARNSKLLYFGQYLWFLHKNGINKE